MTVSSITPRPGDVVLLSFDFLDGTGSKVRPAVAFSSHTFNFSRGYFIFIPLTGSPGHWDDVVEIRDLAPAGLSQRSYSHCMLFTANNMDIIRIRGQLSSYDIGRLRSQISQTIPQ